MLHRYAFSNFHSFANRTEVDLTLNDKVPTLGWEATSAGGQRLTTAVAVIGPNAAGKTALLKPLPFLAWFVSSSFQLPHGELIPFLPHFANTEPSEFEVETEDTDGVLWRYVLRATRERVLHEALYQKKKRFNYVFIRDWQEASKDYAIKQQDFGFPARQARKVRANASLISTAAQYGVELAQELVNIHLTTNVDYDGRKIHNNKTELIVAAEHFAKNEIHKQEMTRLLKAWDLGLGGVVLTEHQVKQKDGEPDVTAWIPYGQHLTSQGKTVQLPFIHESSGTQSAFVLLYKLLPALESGGLVVIDELENDLHPHMLEPILSLFSNPATNPHKAQILFTCHAAEVLNILHKSQVMLVEKDEYSESSAWRMDAVHGIRSEDNFYAKYMAGAYGAVPQV